MTIHANAGRRLTSDVRKSAAPHRGPFGRHAGHVEGGTLGSPATQRAVDFEVLIDRAIAAIRAAGDRSDPVFGEYAELNSVVRAVTYHEGRLLEWGLSRLASENASLMLMPSETALPIVPAALEILKRNDWSGLEGVRLRSDVHYESTYTPDVFLVDRDRHSALLIDVKRSLASYAERRLNVLRRRMLAAALTAADWLHLDGRVAGVSKVGVAIIDGSSERRDRSTGVFALDEVGDLIGVPDAGEAMLRLRAKFAQRVQREVHDVCLRAIGHEPKVEAACRSRDPNDREPGDDASELAVLDGDGDDPTDGASGGAQSRRSLKTMAPSSVARRPIAVGFARGGGP